MNNYVIVLSVVACLGCSGERDRIELNDWETLIRDVGTFSSPRACDLTGDGIKDIVIGSGKVEMQPTDSAIFALNGANGEILWRVQARDQVFGSPSFQDINGDDIPDVFIGGRSAEFLCIDGKTGKVVWEYFPDDETDPTTQKLYNFYNSQFIYDQDQDGVPDVLVANGGYVKAGPYDHERPPGKLMVISGASGKQIAEAYMPDNKEIYMSSILMDEHDEDPRVIFGTGGERIPGNLYVTRLSAILAGDLTSARILVSGGKKGFIAPPVLADINGDHEPDIVANAVEGKMVAIDGKSYEQIWELKMQGTEAYCSIGVGHFDGDGTPDFFTNFGKGTFPDLMNSYQLAVSGRDGELLKLDSMGSFHYGSPVVYDIDSDGFDEVFYHMNEKSGQLVQNVLKVFDIDADTVYNFSDRWRGANIASTPLIEDLDNNGKLEVVCVHENHPVDFFSLEYKTGMVIHTLQTEIDVAKPIKWGSYMGTFYDGRYK